MATVSVDEERLKELFKQALLELLQEKEDALYELVKDVIEQSALVKAIQEGEPTPNVAKAEILRILEGSD